MCFPGRQLDATSLDGFPLLLLLSLVVDVAENPYKQEYTLVNVFLEASGCADTDE